MQQIDTEVIDVASEYVISNTKTKQVEIKNLEELKLKLNTNEIEYIQQNVNIVNNLLNQRIVFHFLLIHQQLFLYLPDYYIYVNPKI